MKAKLKNTTVLSAVSENEKNRGSNLRKTRFEKSVQYLQYLHSCFVCTMLVRFQQSWQKKSMKLSENSLSFKKSASTCGKKKHYVTATIIDHHPQNITVPPCNNETWGGGIGERIV